MKRLTFDFGLRIRLSGILGCTRGLALEESESLGSLYRQVRFTEDEWGQVSMTPNAKDPLLMDFAPPDAAFGVKDVVLEEIQAKHLLSLLRRWNDYAVLDGEWRDPLIEKLAGGPDPDPRRGPSEVKRSSKKRRG
jgi:hypothetical protein